MRHTQGLIDNPFSLLDDSTHTKACASLTCRWPWCVALGLMNSSISYRIKAVMEGEKKLACIRTCAGRVRKPSLASCDGLSPPRTPGAAHTLARPPDHTCEPKLMLGSMATSWGLPVARASQAGSSARCLSPWARSGAGSISPPW